MFKNITLEIKQVKDSAILHINGNPFDSHEILGALGSGANGTVYLANNKILNRKEALKVWLRNRKNDVRDKMEQGLAEARKLAAANKESAVEIYSVQVFYGVPVATMEYINGQTLRDFKKSCQDRQLLVTVAHQYLEAIENTTTRDLMHGDPHLSNVLVYRYTPNMFTDELRLKLCDFGTSIFSGKEHSSARHWRIVEESVIELTNHLEGFHSAILELPRLKANLAALDLDKSAGVFDDQQMAQLRNSPLRDYLDYFGTRPYF